ncbi:hypothetical protein [Paenibacillus macerans]
MEGILDCRASDFRQIDHKALSIAIRGRRHTYVRMAASAPR